MSAVMKFGGTSVADAAAINRLTAIVREQIAREPGERPPVVVVSALSKVTDGLLFVARSIQSGEAAPALARLAEISDRHVGIAAAVTSGARRESVTRDLRAEFTALADSVPTLSSLGGVPSRVFDTIAAAGELASSRLVAAALAESGVPAAWVDARGVMRTDEEFTCAAPDMDATAERVRERVAPVLARGEVAVLGGFIGSTGDGITTTLGRGGSDYSAAIFGACLDVTDIQIWTDVDGMLTADPRVVPHPRLVPQLSFAEASELAYFGAKVLHPSTILPAVSKNIPVRILNSKKPEAPGTLITADPPATPGRLTALACKRDVTVIDITSTRMFMAHGFLGRLFAVFEKFKTPVDVVTTSEVSVSVTVDDRRRVGPIVESLREFAEVSEEGEMAIICAVGEDIHEDPKAFSRAILALESIPLRMVSQAASRRNITFVLRDADVERAMVQLHDAFFGDPA